MDDRAVRDRHIRAARVYEPVSYRDPANLSCIGTDDLRFVARFRSVLDRLNVAEFMDSTPIIDENNSIA